MSPCGFYVYDCFNYFSLRTLKTKQTTPLSEVSENVQKISLQDPSTKTQNCNRKPSDDADKGIFI